MKTVHINILVAEIGSTTTIVNAFNLDDNSAVFVGQGQYRTTVYEGDVTVGLKEAVNDLASNLECDKISYSKMFATSSAAGGLKMCVHGLVYDMTVKAAKEAALGAGANIHMVTAGKLRRTDIKKIKEINPNIILIAGGVDFGERDTAVYNAEKIADLDLHIPVIYAGNIQNQEEVRLIFEDAGKSDILYITDNVYPKIDMLNVEPVRKVIQDVFEEHIIKAPGMEKVKEMVTGPIIPTPGAVMEASKLLKEDIGDLMTVDVGGATTDIHSVTEGSEKINKILLAPEPIAKRTVEGDLGVYINLQNILNMIERKILLRELSLDEEELQKVISEYKAIPINKDQIKLVERLAKEATFVSARRHAGEFRKYFGGESKTFATGKDLTSVKWLIGTGGALTRLPNREAILKGIPYSNKGDKLFPPKNVQVLIDNMYIMASMGVMGKIYPKNALNLMKKSLGILEA